MQFLETELKLLHIESRQLQNAQFVPMPMAEKLHLGSRSTAEIKFFQRIQQCMIERMLSDRLDRIVFQIDTLDFQQLERLSGEMTNEILRKVQFLVNVRTREFRHGVDGIRLALDIITSVDFNATITT